MKKSTSLKEQIAVTKDIINNYPFELVLNCPKVFSDAGATDHRVSH